MTNQVPRVNQIWAPTGTDSTGRVRVVAVIGRNVYYEWQDGLPGSDIIEGFVGYFEPLVFRPDETYPEVRYTRVFKGGTFNGLFACVPDKDDTDAIGVVALKPDWSSYVEYVEPS